MTTLVQTQVKLILQGGVWWLLEQPSGVSLVPPLPTEAAALAVAQERGWRVVTAKAKKEAA